MYIIFYCLTRDDYSIASYCITFLAVCFFSVYFKFLRINENGKCILLFKLQFVK